MKNTSKIVSIDTNGQVLVYSSKGMLSKYIHVSRDTLANWFRHDNSCLYNGVTYYKAARYITGDKKLR